MPIPKPRKVRSRSVVAPASTVASAMNGGGAWLLVAAAAWIVRLVYLGQIQTLPLRITITSCDIAFTTRKSWLMNI